MTYTAAENEILGSDIPEAWPELQRILDAEASLPRDQGGTLLYSEARAYVDDHVPDAGERAAWLDLFRVIGAARSATLDELHEDERARRELEGG